jgi:hypothetical protein
MPLSKRKRVTLLEAVKAVVLARVVRLRRALEGEGDLVRLAVALEIRINRR